MKNLKLLLSNLTKMKIIISYKYSRLYLVAIISIYINAYQCMSSYSQSDSLFSYLEIAAKNNPTVLQLYYDYEASLQKVPQVGSLPDPELSVGVFLKPMELLGGKQIADIRIMQMFPWFGVLNSAKDEMSRMAKAKFESFRNAKLQVFYDVQRSWFELNKIKQDIRISEKNIDILRTIERLSLIKFKASSSEGNSSSVSGGNFTKTSTSTSSSSSSGMQSMGGSSGNVQSSASAPMQNNTMGSTSANSSLVDLYRIQIEIGELENNIALLKNQQNTIAARFNTYLNRKLESKVWLPDSLKADTLSQSFLEISNNMLATNPMLGMINFEQQSYEARKKMVTRMGYPMVGLGLNYSLINESDNAMSNPSMNGKDMIMPMVTLTLPIYRKKYYAMKKEVDFMKSASEKTYQATSNQLQAEYYEALQLYQDAQRRIKLYENQSRLANKSLDITIKDFSSSSSGLTDILIIRQQVLNYEFKMIEAIVDYNTAIAWLKKLGNLEKL